MKSYGGRPALLSVNPICVAAVGPPEGPPRGRCGASFGHILGIIWAYTSHHLGIFRQSFGHIRGITQAYPRHDLSISQASFGHIPASIWAYPSHHLGTFPPSRGHIPAITRAYPSHHFGTSPPSFGHIPAIRHVGMFRPSYGHSMFLFVEGGGYIIYTYIYIQKRKRAEHI
jgi:hypothetical protein